MKIISNGLAKGRHRVAIVAFQKGNYKEASTIWTAILDQQTDDIIALKGLSCCLFLEGKNREARSYLEEALSYSAMDAEITNLLALTYLKEGNVQQAIEQILDAQELQPHPLLNTTLNKIKQLKNPDYAKNMSLIPLIQITLPGTGIFSSALLKKLKKFSPMIIFIIVILSLIIFYPDLRNWVTALNIRNRSEITLATSVNIKGIKDIVNARENFRIILDEGVIVRKYEELRVAISEQNHNRAKILVNELLASNASLAVKERVGILESFIGDPSVDNIDYVPRYAEIAIAPAIYEGVVLRWQGTIANIYHQGRKQTTFDLLVNFVGQGQVEGMAHVELEGFQEFNNGDKVTVMGIVLGITTDNRILIQGERVLPY